LQQLDIVQKIWAPLRKLFAPKVTQAGYGPDCEKGYIYPSRRDVGRRSRKFDKCRANQFLPLLQMRLMLKTQIFFHFQFDGSTTVCYFWTTISQAHLKVFYLLRAWSCLADSNIKNHLRKFGNPLAVDESFSKGMILFFW